MATVKFFAVRLFLGEEEVYLHLRGHKALSKKMVKETILDRWPSAEIDDIRMSSRKPLYSGYGYLTFSKADLEIVPPQDWIYGLEASYDSDGEEYLSGRQFRLPNKVFFELQARERKLAKEEAKRREVRKRLSKEVVGFLKVNKISVDELIEMQEAYTTEDLGKPSLESLVAYLATQKKSH